MCEAWLETLVTWPWLCISMIYCFALRLWSQICITCRSCWFPVSLAMSCCVGARCLGHVGWRHTYEMVTEHFANPNLSVVVAKWWFLGFVVWDRTFMCTVFIATLTYSRWLDFWLFTSINGCRAVQVEDVRASFLFVGDLNGHHQEWLGSTATNRHFVAAFDFATVSGCD